jgi:hypothetical protein
MEQVYFRQALRAVLFSHHAIAKAVSKDAQFSAQYKVIIV